MTHVYVCILHEAVVVENEIYTNSAILRWPGRMRLIPGCKKKDEHKSGHVQKMAENSLFESQEISKRTSQIRGALP